MAVAALFYILRLVGKSLWENGTLAPWQGVWLPLSLAALVALFIVWRMEP
jgi:lipopolysaccharide export LptBFGC system permease protein LptF